MEIKEAIKSTINGKVSKDARIILMQLPYWTPLIPPQGIARLKAFLKRFGYQNVKSIDANMETGFKDLYEKYFDTAKVYIPQEKQGNFYDNGHDLLRNHLLVKLNQHNENDYFKLISLFFQETYLYELSIQEIISLDHIIDDFYKEFEKYILDVLKKEEPVVLGLTVHGGNLPPSMLAFRLAKEQYPTILNVMGGSIFAAEFRPNTPDFEYFLGKTESYLDKIIIGQGERLFLKLLEGEFPSHKRIITHDDIKGEILSISAAEKPDLSDFDLGKYSCMASFCSKSCPNRCSFCNERAFFGDYEARDIRKAVEEMIDIYRQSGVRLFYMLDVIMNDLITDFTTELAKQAIPLYFDCYLRVSDEISNPENAFSYRQGGCYRVRIGVESGSQRMLDLIGKEIKVEQTKATLASLANAGIKTTAYLVVGLPGETDEDIQKTLDFLEESKDNLYQVEPHLFRYFYEGQAHSDKWAENRVSLYPEKFRDSLICRTWWVNEEPSRRKAVERLCLMVEHCRKLGITNPYTIYDKYKADLRWKKLHENAVPLAAELNGPPEKLFAERNTLKKRILAKTIINEVGDFHI